MNRLFQFKPVTMERVWGGRSLKERLGRKLPEGKPIGESWEIVDREDVQSVVVGGPHHGKTLHALLVDEGKAILGERFSGKDRFPILVKWLDCRERLSLQVHPPASVAAELQGEPKTENWYIAHCVPGARLLAGLKSGVTREAFYQGLKSQTLESLVHSIPVEPGDSMLVKSGRIHAIDRGNLILEIQQNSDTTYRVYDWGRVGLDGNPRELHIEQSMQSIDFEDYEPSVIKAREGDQTLAECDEFRIRKLECGDRAEVRPGNAREPALLHLVTGSIEFPDTSDGSVTLDAGDNVLLPAGFASTGRARGNCVCLVTDRFLA